MPNVNYIETDDINSVNSFDYNKKVKIKKRKYYPTGRGCNIVNAISGHQYPWIQGSFDEKRLFKVIDTTSYYDESGYVRSKRKATPGYSNMLYFDSPEQYMIFMGIKLENSKIMRWHDNYRKTFKEEINF